MQKFIYRSLTCTKLGGVFRRVLSFLLYVQCRYVPTCNTIQCMSIRKYDPFHLIMHELMSMYGKWICVYRPLRKVFLKQYLNSSVGRASYYESKRCGFESHCGREFFHFVFFRFSCCLTEPIRMKSSMTFTRGKGCIIIKKANIGENCGVVEQ